jgi:hypothetical protein
MAYLISEYDFLPTGLSAGKTLADLDLVGRRRGDGTRIYAQCKKSGIPVNIEDGFLSLAEVDHASLLFYFSFGGISGIVPDRITAFSRNDALAWSKTSAGEAYMALLI